MGVPNGGPKWGFQLGVPNGGPTLYIKHVWFHLDNASIVTDDSSQTPLDESATGILGEAAILTLVGEKEPVTFHDSLELIK
jgi:hypothetical protein